MSWISDCLLKQLPDMNILLHHLQTHVYGRSSISFDKLTTSGDLGPHFSDTGLYIRAIVPSYSLTASIPLLLLGNDVS